ncbi:DNA-directed RNA polymerase subunit delta [Bacillus chungangensis]|uniref:Probable DNA-directed RNA polymerase subunit delta n=2 Tax=Bacillus chungangensis TaxID=587633 RepID=A0ABT9WWM5_9BACI|nr:DNA-directed RNA polymerase subunit delta [Bacillus chungangensis]
MPMLSLQELPTENLEEQSFIDAAHSIFKNKKEVLTFKELLDKVASSLQLTEEQVRARMVQFYTDLNIDGRFMALGENRWGLRAWYPIDQIDEEVVPSVKTKKKKGKKVKEEVFLEDDDLEYDDVDEFDEEDDLLENDEEDEEVEEFDEELEEDEEEFDDEEIIDDDEFELDSEDELEEAEEE